MSRNGVPAFREDLLEEISNAPEVSGGESSIRELGTSIVSPTVWRQD